MRRLLRIAIGLVALVAVVAVALGVAFWRAPIGFVERGEQRALAAAGFVERSAEAPRGRVVWFDGGSSSEVLVFLHGVNDRAGAWSKIAPTLARYWRVVLVDLPGHGASEPADGPLAPDDYLAGIDAVLAVASPARPVVLVGNSMGGWLALLYARAHPTRVAQVVLVNGAALSATPPPDFTLLPHTRAEARREVQILFGPNAPYVANFVLDDLVRRSATAPMSRMKLPPAPEFLLDGALGTIGVPVDLVHGEDDGLLTVAYAQRVAAELGDAKVEVLPRCGHVPQRLCPEAFLEALQRTLMGRHVPCGDCSVDPAAAAASSAAGGAAP